MKAEDGRSQAPAASGDGRPENVIERSVRAFLVAPLIQNVVLWIVVMTTVLSGGAVKITFSSGFWWFAGGVLVASYAIAGTLGLIVHVICVKLGFWRLWHYLLAGFLAGAVPAMLWGLAIASPASISRMTGLAIYFVPSALVVALVVWLMVFWRNPPRAT